jgi:hypothetical protein
MNFQRLARIYNGGNMTLSEAHFWLAAGHERATKM